MASPLLLPLLNWARKLRFPTLFKITAILFAVNILIPDPIPFVDEILLGLARCCSRTGRTARPRSTTRAVLRLGTRSPGAD